MMTIPGNIMVTLYGADDDVLGGAVISLELETWMMILWDFVMNLQGFLVGAVFVGICVARKLWEVRERARGGG